MKKPLIDAHCHVFNKDILTYRILFRLSESLIYALRHNEKKENKGHRDLLAMMEELQNIVHFLKAGLEDSSAEVFERMQNSYNNVFKQNFYAVPLTFDLLYCFKGSMESENSKTIQRDEIDEHTKSFKIHFKKIINLLEDNKEEIKKIISSAENTNNGKATANELSGIIDFLKEKIEEVLEFFKEMDFIGSWNNQLEEMEKLLESHNGQVFPFYAADPRRPNIVTKIKQNVKKGTPDADKKYCGVKIYAPNGYSPTSPKMLKIYEYCVENDIPLTAHCSHGGFASFENKIKVNGLIMDLETGLPIQIDNDYIEFDIPFLSKGWVEHRAAVLNDPDLWEKVLEQFPTLKLNLAHFGNYNDGYVWTEKIFKLMSKFPNLHTDLSCVSDRTKLITFKQLFWDKADESVKSRFLYGSDFYLNLMFSTSFDTFLQNFKDIFNETEFDQIAYTNTINFLGFSPNNK